MPKRMPATVGVSSTPAFRKLPGVASLARRVSASSGCRETISISASSGWPSDDKTVSLLISAARAGSDPARDSAAARNAVQTRSASEKNGGDRRLRSEASRIRPCLPNRHVECLGKPIVVGNDELQPAARHRVSRLDRQCLAGAWQDIRAAFEPSERFVALLQEDFTYLRIRRALVRAVDVQRYAFRAACVTGHFALCGRRGDEHGHGKRERDLHPAFVLGGTRFGDFAPDHAVGELTPGIRGLQASKPHYLARLRTELDDRRRQNQVFG